MDILDQYKEVRTYTEQICKPLQTEDYVVQVAEFASPAKWQLAHSSWFFETFILLPHLPDYKLFNKDFPFLFNSYYNNAGDRVLRAKRGNLTRPTTDEVYAYRQYVDTAMGQLLNQKLDADIVQLVTLGLHHEQQHQELLLSDIKYMFGQNPLFPAYDSDTSLLDQERNIETGSVKIPEGVYTIGYQGEGFCFDNELGVHKVYLHDFEIQKGLVTNGEYLEFIKAGGYKDFNLWLDEGWSWLKQNQVSMPLYWHEIDGQWMHYTLKGFQKINENDILKHISFYEAMAFAEWKGMRLPTEFEWEIASGQLNWGQRWEWTNSAYLPYPGFKKADGAIGEYNGKFMINQMVLRGASMATSPKHSRPTYRNFFHPSAQWQYTGIRLAK
ncbi:ergothioneine biosynthesis protein EgtB [Arenibacter palladensis]|uniref:ergothioneine biosynthesis protein EgtB n=1 Tax=Arenibacter palladensis TaxID=237373 RepID=UPI0026E19F69|nr:ergothioneine biosynthesis protein EgtB [Arenibacter palladensis]MDO6602585.1 ergothioneine biosynthesis protein EgtB [Arenibacter palladensis]